MSEFDDFIRGIGSDIKNVAEKVGKKAEETFEISKSKKTDTARSVHTFKYSQIYSKLLASSDK